MKWATGLVRLRFSVLKKCFGHGKRRLDPATLQKAIQLKAQGLPTSLVAKHKRA